ncbi:hypothetical protein SAMIE_1002490 [Sphingobium amiense]|uniref:Tryptophan halogenase n=2 Tax=Sphingobium amiense TaxID=135719 RepID=A0A494W0N7_9SPHN|nr:hypothetical protein SAMIE_1002490 [Sphingobium amiense]
MVLGAGPVGLLAAIALRRALPVATIHLIDTGHAGGTLADSFPLAYPPALAVLDRLGLGEDMLVRECGATHKLADRFHGWGREDFTVSVQESEVTTGGVPMRLVAGARGDVRTGLGGAAALAEKDRLAPDRLDGSAAGRDIGYALRLDAPRLTACLRTIAARAGVRHASAASVTLTVAADGTLSVAAGAELPVVVDLLIESRGAGHLLADAPAEDWSAEIPEGSVCREPLACHPSLSDLITAHGWGWTTLMPGQRDGERVSVFDIESARHAEGLIRETAAGAIPFRTGRLTCPMDGRRVALGDAAAIAGPLGHFGFSLALLHLDLLLDLLPAASPEPVLAREYNRRANLMSDELRDFVALLFAFHKAARPGPAAARLALVIERFARTGRLPLRETDLVSDAAWVGAMAGLVEAAPGYDVTAEALATGAGAALAARRREVEALCASHPAYRLWLEERMANGNG